MANAGNVTLDDKNSLTLAGINATGAVAVNFGQANGGGTLSLGTGAITGTSITVTGGTGSDTVVGQTGAHTWNLTGSNSGDIDGSIDYASVENLTGNSGNDTFKFNGGSVTGTIDGGAGSNTLDYSLVAGPISVNLARPVIS